MATKTAKFDIDKMVADAQQRVQEFIDVKFDKLQTETKAGFAEALKTLNAKGI